MGGGGGGSGGGGGHAITRDGGPSKAWAVAQENGDLVSKGARQERGRGRRRLSESGTPKFNFVGLCLVTLQKSEANVRPEIGNRHQVDIQGC